MVPLYALERCSIRRSIQWLIVILFDCRQKYTEAHRLINELFQRLMGFRVDVALVSFFVSIKKQRQNLYFSYEHRNENVREQIWICTVSMRNLRYYQSLDRLKAFLRWIDERIAGIWHSICGVVNEIYDSKNYHVIIKCVRTTKHKQITSTVFGRSVFLFIIHRDGCVCNTHGILGIFRQIVSCNLFCVRV